jgi:radical SAM superfamily enzyme YgiQ (UPF0313 family)
LSNEYSIMYNPLTFNLMDMPINRKTTGFHLISYLTGLNGHDLDSGNYLDYLKLDMKKHREGMVETFAIDSYAALYIGNQIGKIDKNVRVIHVDGKRRTIQEVILDEGQKPKAVFISSMSSNFPTSVAIAIILNFAKIPVVIGGIHVSTSKNDVNDFILKYCPNPELIAQVFGPGDTEVISRIITDLNTGKLEQSYQGNITVEDNIWKPLNNVQYLPPMHIDLLRRIPIVGKFLREKMRLIPVAPFLGCPFSCNFCSISTLPANQRKLTIRSTEDFLDELEYHQRSGRINSRSFFFLPDNLLLGGKSLVRILDGIIARNLKVNFTAQISIDVASNEKLLKRLRLAGATHFFIGFETLDVDNLKFIGKHIVKQIKKEGLTPKLYYKKLIQKVQDYGISIHGAFIFGLPFDYFNSFQDNTGVEIAKFCIENNIGLQPCSLTDLPGSKLFKETQETETWLYGKQGTMEYLLALCLTDLTETNRIPPKRLSQSPLKVASMAYDAIQMAGTMTNSFKNGLFMAMKAFFHPTYRGRQQFKERIIDALFAFTSQLIVSLYKDHGERVGISSNGIRGGLERLYDLESNNEVKAYFKEYITKFKE